MTTPDPVRPAPVSGNPTRPSRLSDQGERKAHVLTKHSASVVRSIADAVVIKEGEPFFLCPPDGQIEVSGSHGFGLYHHDTRFLSGYELIVAGAKPNPLASTAVTGSLAMLELTTPVIDLGDGRTIAKERLAVRWSRELNGDAARLVDRITCRSYDANAARLPIGLSFAADFEDVFVVRGLLRELPGKLHDPAWEAGRLVFRYEGHDGVDRTLTISVQPEPAAWAATSCEVWVEVPAHGEAEIEVRMDIDESLKPGASPIERRAPKGHGARRQAGHPDSRTDDTERSGGDGWPVSVSTDGLSVNAALARSFDDLLTLRGELGGQRYYAAGVPWFSTLFGRDSLISAYQTLAFDPRIAEETLRLLARRQGEHVDDWRDEQPGRILHELRVGELARLHEIPHTPYFGSIDATPLFLVLLARHASWVGSLDLFRELRPNVERALEWIDRFGVLDDSGFVAYDSTTKHALMNQGWKDSGDAIVTVEGDVATPPIALAEVQGYVYAAKREVASLYERDGNRNLADRLRHEAEALRDRFERAFWSEDLGCYALALEANGKRCEVATSNAGQVLWSGIAGDDHAQAVAARLLRQDLFGGWGVRTLSSEAAAYNPIGYHLGTVWPHDNGLIAEGLRRYGRDEEAEKIFMALIEAAMDFPQQRLPECFAGYDRAEFGTPVRYPVACHPQAWAAGATPHLLTTSLGLVAEAFEGRLRVIRPRLPPFLEHVNVRGLRVGAATVSLAFERTGRRTSTSIQDLKGDLDVRIEDVAR
jgi:glycogen debranching enzyme